MSKFLFDFSGKLLIATPNVKESSKKNAVVFITGCTGSKITGVQLNNPLNQSVEQRLSSYTCSEILDAPLYKGGTEDENILSISAWIWTNEMFELLFHVKDKDLIDIKKKYADANIQLRGYIGHMSWDPLQLFAEILDHSWYPVPLSSLFGLNSKNLWPGIVLKTNPKLFLMSGNSDCRYDEV